MSKLHFPGLNGLRAIAASGVVVRHLSADLEAKLQFTYAARSDLAGYGVTLFFVLSGYLITYLLLLEKVKTNTISIKKFYTRRILRIWPLYYAYLLIALLCIYFFDWQGFQSWIIPLYLFLLPNVSMMIGVDVNNLINHYWTLGVEEQFYIFWPLIIKWSKHILRTLVIFAAVFFILKVTVILLNSRVPLSYARAFFYYNRFHCMALGGIAATLIHAKSALFYNLITSYVFQCIGWLSMLLVIFNKFNISSTFNQEIFSVIAVILIVNVSQNPKSIIRLENSVWNFLGKISYSIYVIHPLCIFICSKLLYHLNIDFIPRLILIFCFVCASTICLSYLSYTYFERWFIKRKDKFSVIKSTA